MLTMLLIGIQLLADESAIAAAVSEQSKNRSVHVTNRASHWVKEVYVGDSDSMPVDGGYLIAIDLPRENLTPATVEGALLTMKASLPSWYLESLEQSSYCDECRVMVNGQNYTQGVMSWFEYRWDWLNPNSSLRAELASFGFTTGADSLLTHSVLAPAFCRFIKTGDVSQGLGVIRGLASQPVPDSRAGEAVRLMQIEERLVMREPLSFADALTRMTDALPAWYRSVLVKSDDENCSVEINGQSYENLVNDWFAEKWSISDPESPLRRHMRPLGFSLNNSAEYPARLALGAGACALVKSGSLDAAIAAAQRHAAKD